MNLFALSCIITAVFTAIMCFVILLNNIREKINRAWFFTCLSLFVWQVGLYGTVVAGNAEDALFWQRILYIGTILIPVFFFYFCLNFLKRKEDNKALFIGFFLSIFFVLLSFSRFFIVGVGTRVDFGYWPVQTGSLYFLFLIYFAFYAVYSIAILKIDSKKYNGEYQKQIQFMYYAALIGFVGGSTNFLLDFGINTYSLGNWALIFYIIFVSYALFKHHLFNIKVIATELLTFALWITLFIKIFASGNTKDLVLNICILLVVIIIGIWLILSVIKEVRQKEKIEKIEKELEKAYGVEKEAHELANKANEELEKLDKYKDDFLRQAQHDLKRPLTTIMGYCELLIGGNFGKISKKGLDVIKRMQAVTRGKMADINNFLDIEQFKAGKGVISLKPGIEILPILEQVSNELAFQAESKGIYLKLEKFEKTLVVSADREKLKAALFNIVDNAVKYTEKGGINIKVESNENIIKIIVSDTGIGIPPEKIKNMLEVQFERTEKAEKTASGSGVGLYLSAQIIKLHNGKVWAESDGEGKGSTFNIELPVAQETKNIIEPVSGKPFGTGIGV